MRSRANHAWSSGAASNAPVDCYREVRDLTQNPDVLCSANGALKAVTHHDIHRTYPHPYPFPFPHPYPYRYPYPDPNRDPSQDRKP